MKQSSLVHSCSYSRVFRCGFFLLSFCIILVPTTHAQAIHRRLWPWPSWPGPYPLYRPRPWPLDPPSPKPSPPPGPSPCPVTPPEPQPKPPPAPGPPCPPTRPKPSPAPNPSPCPPMPPKPSPAPSPSPCPPTPPKPSPAPSPSPCPPTPPKPSPDPCPPIPPKPQPKPNPPPGPSPCPPIPPKPQPKPPPAPGPEPKPGPSPSPPKPPVPNPKPIPPPPVPNPKPTPPAPGPPKPEDKTIPAVFFFGDSVVDTGNNNDRKTKIKSNYRPYGMDFKHGVATGRFSNGMVASDFLSKYLGVKETVPAYLDPKLQPKDLLTGVSFASGGAGYNPKTSEALKGIPMLDQLTFFQDYIQKINKLVRQDKSQGNLVGLEKANQIIAKGVAIVVAGGNDLVTTYFGSGAQRLKNDVDSYTTTMADSAASFVLQLYGYGARRIGVIGTPPLGCTPSQRVKKKKVCNVELNYAAQLFNSKLLIILGQLSKTLPNSTLVYMDVYTIFSQMQETPEDYGFEEIKKPCCKPGLFGGDILCKKSTSKICPNTSSYMFWDGIHPTQSAYESINKILVKEYLHALSK